MTIIRVCSGPPLFERKQKIEDWSYNKKVTVFYYMSIYNRAVKDTAEILKDTEEILNGKLHFLRSVRGRDD